MTKKYSVVLMANENLCTVKQVSKNTYDQINNMKDRGEKDAKITKSLTELDFMEDNITMNGVSKSEAIQYALDEGDDYIIIKAFDT
jgi:hypothetical protein